jgi:anti-sigma regulatory factor (Ser/Thr protein kinase)
MKELSLHVLDVAKNSVKAGATLTKIEIERADDGMMTVRISDNGCGMSEDILKRVTDPFYTTRTTRKVGLGLPLWRLAAEQTGGYMTIESSTEAGNSGTVVTAVFDTRSIDCMPMGDIVSTVVTLVSGSPDSDFLFTDSSSRRVISLDTREMRAVLGEDVSLALPDVQLWMTEYLNEQYNN